MQSLPEAISDVAEEYEEDEESKSIFLNQVREGIEKTINEGDAIKVVTSIPTWKHKLKLMVPSKCFGDQCQNLLRSELVGKIDDRVIGDIAKDLEAIEGLLLITECVRSFPNYCAILKSVQNRFQASIANQIKLALENKRLKDECEEYEFKESSD